MYTVNIDGEIKSMERLSYVKKQSNGMFIHCAENEASGIIIGKEIYALPGNDIGKSIVYIAWAEDVSPAVGAVSTMLGSGGDISIDYLAAQFNALRNIVIKNIDQISTESEKMQFVDLYPTWESGKKYTDGDICSFGVNLFGETQLYQAVKNHVSKPEQTPDAYPELFKKIGVMDDGTPLWTRPICKNDKYDKGDIVYHNGCTWSSDINNNAYEPGVDGWKEVKEGLKI